MLLGNDPATGVVTFTGNPGNFGSPGTWLSGIFDGFRIDPYKSVNTLNLLAYHGTQLYSGLVTIDKQATLDNTINVQQTIDGVEMGDFNGDHINDAAILLQENNLTFTLFGVATGNGDGSFGSPQYFSLDPTSGAVADFNGDGSPDLALPGHSGGLNVVLNGTSGPTAVRIARFTARRHGVVLTFSWRVSTAAHIAGFDLYAGGRRLNRQPIGVHPSGSYRYTARYAGAGPYVLRAVLDDGGLQTAEVS
jgi:hypothetical protein